MTEEEYHERAWELSEKLMAICYGQPLNIVLEAVLLIVCYSLAMAPSEGQMDGAKERVINAVISTQRYTPDEDTIQ